MGSRGRVYFDFLKGKDLAENVSGLHRVDGSIIEDVDEILETKTS